MQTFVEMSKSQAVLARSVKPGLSRVRQDVESKSDSMGRRSSGLDYNFARIPLFAPESGATRDRAPSQRNGGEEPEEERMKVAADIGLNFTQLKRDEIGSGANDKVASGVGIGKHTQPGGKTVEEKADEVVFGSTSYESSFSGRSHKFSHGVCTITAKLDVSSPWGTRDEGRTDVPSATDGVVTAKTWPKIKSDLTPIDDPPFSSPRDKYYSKDLVEKHELFHGTDEFGWTERSGLEVVKESLEAETVTVKGAATEVPALLSAAKGKLDAAREKYYKGHGKDHDTYSGELRAYSKFVGAYRKLAADVEKQGKSLMGPPRQTKRRP